MCETCGCGDPDLVPVTRSVDPTKLLECLAAAEA